jgi:integrase
MKKDQAIRRTIEVIRLKHLSYETEKAYVRVLRKYIHAIWQMPNHLSSEEKIERYLTELAVVKDVAASTQNQEFNAILFFYRDVLRVELKNIDALRATRPSRVRLAPTVRETYELLNSIRDFGGYPTNLACNLLYGCGLRVSEACALRLKDVRLEDSKLFVMCAKGGKDRVQRIPCSLFERLHNQIEIAKTVWARDCKTSLPIQLPHRLRFCNPELEYSWQWAWLFPLHHPSDDPREPGRLVRWHMLPDSIQRAVKSARRKLGIMVTPHNLRHGYATHSLERGIPITSIQKAMGHKNVETTALYCHNDAMSVPSPLDVLNQVGAVMPGPVRYGQLNNAEVVKLFGH